MWPLSELSLATATRISDWANLALIGSLIAGVLSTFVIVQMGNIKESHWDRERDQSKERIARLNNETEHLKADNLALQTVLLPRHVGLIGLDGPPKALEWFSGFEALAGTEISIQVAPDAEAQRTSQMKLRLCFRNLAGSHNSLMKNGHVLHHSEYPMV